MKAATKQGQSTHPAQQRAEKMSSKQACYVNPAQTMCHEEKNHKKES